MTAPGHAPGPLRLALWLGLLTGFTEALLLAVERVGLGRLIFLSPHFSWMAPAGEVGFFLAPGLLLWLLWRRAPTVQRWRWSLGALLFLSGFAVLLMYPPLHRGAAALLALGVAVQGVRLVGDQPAWFGRMVRASTWGMLALAVLLAVGIRSATARRERQALAALPAAADGAPNVLLIILDTVRAMSLSLYGYGRETSPQLARWGARGVVFDRAIAPAPWTLPSHASMFTGRWPHELAVDWRVAMDGRFPTLAGQFAARGYRTVGIVANTTYLSEETGLNRGFAQWESYPSSLAMIVKSASLGRFLDGQEWLRRALGYHQPLARRLAPEINASLLRWVDQGGRRPFFAVLNYFDAHAPYLPPPGWSGKFGQEDQRRTIDLEPGWPYTAEEIASQQNAYDASLAYLDAEIGRLLDSLEARGALRHTLVVVTSDHGEEFHEHGFMDHGNTLYRPSVEVPLLLWYPDRLPAGSRVTVPVSIRSLPATILDLAGLPPGAVGGRSLARTWAAPESLAAAAPDTILSEVNFTPGLPAHYPVSKGRLSSIVEEGMRYIRNGDGRAELYDFDHDPGERTDLAPVAGRLPVVQRLGASLDRITQSAPP